MFVIKDRFGNKFPWSRKGKNRECEVRDNKCIVRKCFKPEDCGTIDQKTQQKNIVGKCRTMHDEGCPDNWDRPENYVVYNDAYEKSYRNGKNNRNDRNDRNDKRDEENNKRNGNNDRKYGMRVRKSGANNISKVRNLEDNNVRKR